MNQIKIEFLWSITVHVFTHRSCDPLYPTDRLLMIFVLNLAVDRRDWREVLIQLSPAVIGFPCEQGGAVVFVHASLTTPTTEPVKRGFQRFCKLPGEMFRHEARTHTVAEHFSQPFSERGKNSFGARCTCERSRCSNLAPSICPMN